MTPRYLPDTLSFTIKNNWRPMFELFFIVDKKVLSVFHFSDKSPRLILPLNLFSESSVNSNTGSNFSKSSGDSGIHILFFTSITSFACSGFSNTDFLTQLDNNLGYGVGFNLNIPIFNGFKTDASVQRSKINKLITETRLESEKLQLQQTIEQSFQDAKAAAKSFEAAELSLKAQKEAFKNAQVSYDYGSMTQFDYDQVRNRLVNAEGTMIRAKYNYVFTTKVLKFYYGEDILLD